MNQDISYLPYTREEREKQVAGLFQFLDIIEERGNLSPEQLNAVTVLHGIAQMYLDNDNNKGFTDRLQFIKLQQHWLQKAGTGVGYSA